MITLIIISVAVLVIYSALMIWLFVGIYSASLPKLHSTNSMNPSVTIIVSLRNESTNIGVLLEGLQALKYPENLLEIILVNDHSTDSTYEDLLMFQSSQITILNNEGAGKKRAIETGVEVAKGDWVAVTDADCIIPKTWLSSMVKSITDNSKMILGPVFISDTNSFLGSLQAIEFLGLQGATAGSAGMRKPISANAANMLFRKDVFEEVNPYVDNYELKTGDDQFLLMAISSRYSNSVVYSKRKESIVLTKPVDNFRQYMSQRIRWASKGSSYSQFIPQLVGMIVFITSLLVMIDFAYAVKTENWVVFIIPFSIKLVCDLWVVLPMKRFSNTSINPFYYLGSTMLYPLVVVVSVMAGLVRK